MELFPLHKPISMLIIDDNRILLNTLSEYIEEHYANQIQIVGMAQTSAEGIRLARALSPQGVLLDLKMPDMHGFEVIPLLRQVNPEVKIITTTLISSELFEQSGAIYREESLKAGADAFIPKFRLDKDLASTILKMINLMIGTIR